MDLSKLSSDSIREWITNHETAIAAGVNVGTIAQAKAQRFRIELIRRNA
jgi:hypothetical protein